MATYNAKYEQSKFDKKKLIALLNEISGLRLTGLSAKITNRLGDNSNFPDNGGETPKPSSKYYFNKSKVVTLEEAYKTEQELINEGIDVDSADFSKNYIEVTYREYSRPYHYLVHEAAPGGYSQSKENYEHVYKQLKRLPGGTLSVVDSRTRALTKDEFDKINSIRSKSAFTAKEALLTILEVGGFFFEPFDFLALAIYASIPDHFNTIFTIISVIPGVGSLIKLGLKKFVNTKTMKIVGKLSSELLNSKALKSVISQLATKSAELALKASASVNSFKTLITGNYALKWLLGDEILLELVSYVDDIIEGLNNLTTTLQKKIDDLAKSLDDAAKGTSILDQSVIDDILSTPKGSRPDPSTYLSQEYITNHLSQFDEGMSKFAYGMPKYPDVGHPSGHFVMPKSVADDLLQRAGGDVRELERLLGLPVGDLGDAPIRIDFPEVTGLRMPTGNEFGANDLWLPGGFTDSGAIPEAVIDQVPVEKAVFTDLFK